MEYPKIVTYQRSAEEAAPCGQESLKHKQNQMFQQRDWAHWAGAVCHPYSTRVSLGSFFEMHASNVLAELGMFRFCQVVTRPSGGGFFAFYELAAADFPTAQAQYYGLTESKQARSGCKNSARCAAFPDTSHPAVFCST